MLLTWVRAVRSVMNSAVAISLLLAPWPTSEQHLALALGERLGLGLLSRRSRMRWASSRATAGSSVHLARVRGPHGVGDLVGLGVLEQVAGRARLEGGGDLLFLDERS